MQVPGVRQIPIFGGSLYRAGQVISILSQPCSPMPTITVRAMFANLPMLVWTLVKPDPVDFLSSKFGDIHKKRRRRRLHVGAVDVGLPGDGKGIRSVEWMSFKFKERVGWYFLVMDATATFAVNWMSMAYLYSGCKDPLSGYGAVNYEGNFGWLSNGTEFQMGLGTPDSGPGYFANAANVQKLNPGPRMATAYVKFGANVNTPRGTIQRVFIRKTTLGGSTDSDLDMSFEQDGKIQSASGSIVGYNTLELAATYQVWVQATTGWITVTAWNLTVSGFDQPGIEPDP